MSDSSITVAIIAIVVVALVALAFVLYRIISGDEKRSGEPKTPTAGPDTVSPDSGGARSSDDAGGADKPDGGKSAGTGPRIRVKMTETSHQPSAARKAMTSQEAGYKSLLQWENRRFASRSCPLCGADMADGQSTCSACGS